MRIAPGVWVAATALQRMRGIRRTCCHGCVGDCVRSATQSWHTARTAQRMLGRHRADCNVSLAYRVDVTLCVWTGARGLLRMPGIQCAYDRARMGRPFAGDSATQRVCGRQRGGEAALCVQSLLQVSSVPGQPVCRGGCAESALAPVEVVWALHGVSSAPACARALSHSAAPQC